MNPQISVITLGVRDLNRAKQFYSEGLGCPIQRDAGKFVSFSLGLIIGSDGFCEISTKKGEISICLG